MLRTVLNISDIKNNPNNPRVIKDDKFKKLVASIQEFPEMLEAREIVVNQDNIILGGNMRFKAAKEAGLTEVPVKVVDWPEEKQREFVIKDNVSGGEWDWDLLANEWDMEELDEWGLDIPTDLEPETEIEEDEAPEVDESGPPKSVLGEVYQLGRHRLMCGSATEIKDVRNLINDQTINLVITDPPYNVAFNGRSGNHDVIENDNLSEYDFRLFITEFVSVLKEINPDNYYVWCNWKFYGLLQDLLDFKSCIVWAKNVFGMGKGYRHQHEFCLFNGKIDNGINNESDLWHQKKDSNYVHPTQKPLELAVRAMNNHKLEQNVLDLFGGSGFTLMAAEQVGRNAFIMELDPKYVDVIRKRYHKFVTGNEEGWEDATPKTN